MSRFYLPLLSLLFLATAALAQQPRSSSALPSSPGAQSVVRSAYGEKLRLTGLPNGGRVNEFLYRGAQPHIEGIPELKKLGITTIVDLRGEDSGRRESEKEQAEALGMQFVSIPVSGWSPPSNEQGWRNFYLCFTTILKKRFLCIADSATIAPVFLSRPIAWHTKAGLHSKP